ncbi:hypothetical protein LTR78_010314 [Recurvomyces mirabilis]|uniref:Uncharacterized protein n=2 Tax=Recurvomyces mirabilis TaxID=574656 RepID=A0AAE0TMM9_9PEZI|nr:hypothetical protein LTR78_010314 [Recurvomyces mirabilis]
MSRCGQLNVTFSQALQVLERMIDEGSRFANLEKVIGSGAVFLLCHPGSDALGTRLLPKSGPKFDAVVEELRIAGVEEKAAEYADLRKLVITWYHDHVLNDSRASDASITATPPPSSTYTGTDRTNLLADVANSPFHHDPFLSRSYSPSLFSSSGND